MSEEQKTVAAEAVGDDAFKLTCPDCNVEMGGKIKDSPADPNNPLTWISRKADEYVCRCDARHRIEWGDIRPAEAA